MEQCVTQLNTAAEFDDEGIEIKEQSFLEVKGNWGIDKSLSVNYLLKKVLGAGKVVFF